MRKLLPLNRLKLILVVLLIILAGVSFFYNQFLLNKIMEQERTSIELWAEAFEFYNLPSHDRASNDLFSVADELERYQNVPDSLSRMILEAEANESNAGFDSFASASKIMRDKLS